MKAVNVLDSLGFIGREWIETALSITNQPLRRFSRLYWSGVAFNGVLQVADAQALQGLLQQVIGHAKAFGCGLLSLARI